MSRETEYGRVRPRRRDPSIGIARTDHAGTARQIALVAPQSGSRPCSYGRSSAPVVREVSSPPRLAPSF
jgi:hypothetical protein